MCLFSSQLLRLLTMQLTLIVARPIRRLVLSSICHQTHFLPSNSCNGVTMSKYQMSKRSSWDDADCTDAGRDDSYSSLDSGVPKIVTRLVWENILNQIICVAASPFLPPFSIHYALLVSTLLFFCTTREECSRVFVLTYIYLNVSQ